MSLNRLRELFQSGKGAVGTFVSMGNESVVECLGYTGLDFVIIDTEHGPFDTETMMQLIRAAERVGLVPVVRIANVDHKEIQRAADCGAQGLIVPCLRDIKDFQKTVALAKYAPIRPARLYQRAGDWLRAIALGGDQYAGRILCQ